MADDVGIMAGIRDVDDRPVPREQYAEHLRSSLGQGSPGRQVTLGEREGVVIAELLDELAAVYPGEGLGTLSRELAVRLWDRLGI